jgi:hypothetical protein
MGTPQRFDTEERTKAAKIKAALTEETTYIRDQKNLTREGKSARIAKAIVTAQGRLAELRQAQGDRQSRVGVDSSWSCWLAEDGEGSGGFA